MTPAGRALIGALWDDHGVTIPTRLVEIIEAEARAEALAAVRAAVEAIPNDELCFCDADRRVDSDQLYIHKAAVLAAFDKVEKG